MFGVISDHYHIRVFLVVIAAVVVCYRRFPVQSRDGFFFQQSGEAAVVGHGVHASSPHLWFGNVTACVVKINIEDFLVHL